MFQDYIAVIKDDKCLILHDKVISIAEKGGGVLVLVVCYSDHKMFE